MCKINVLGQWYSNFCRKLKLSYLCFAEIVTVLSRDAAEAQTSIRLASHLVRAPNSKPEGSEFESLAWTKSECCDYIEDLWGVQYSILVTPMILSCLTCSTLRNACSLARHSHVRLTCPSNFSLYQGGTGGNYLEKPNETQTSWLASFLVKSPIS